MKQSTGMIFPLKTVLLYLLIGGAWFAGANHVFGIFVQDPRLRAVIPLLSGWIFLGASVVFIFLVLKRQHPFLTRSESALLESEEKYRLLMMRANDGIVIADAESGRVLEVNGAIEDLTGLPAAALVGRQLSDLASKSDSGQCRKLFEDLLKNQSAMTGEFCILRRDGSDTIVEINASIVQIGGRRIVQGIMRDMTQRKAAEAGLRKEKERAESYLNVAGVMIVVLDSEGFVSLINRQGCDILGYQEEEIVGKPWFDLFIPERMRYSMKSGFKKLIDAGEKPIEFYEAPVRRQNGEERAVSWHLALLKNDEGKVSSVLASGEDITAWKQAEELARDRLEHLSALHAIDLIISSSLDLRVTLQQFLDLVITRLRVDAADVLLLNRHTKTLEFAAMQGFRSPRIRLTRLRLGEGIAGRAALERRSIGIGNLQEAESGHSRSYLLGGENFEAYYVVPLIAKGQVRGVLEILHRSPLGFSEEWVNLLEALAAQAAIAIDNATLFDDLQRSNEMLVLAYDTTIEGWARALELRDQETEGHTQRAAELTLTIGRAMGMSEEELVHMRRGALLHDIGKMSIPDSILFKRGPLTDEEWKIMRRHPVYAFELLSRIAYLRPAIDIPYGHHERWDGNGYPRGLKGEEIPLAARVFAAADTWDALLFERRYHPAWPENRVREHIRSLAGVQLDPEVVAVFLNRVLPEMENVTAEQG